MTITPILDGSPEWHAARLNGFGASEGAAVCGFGEFTTGYEVVARKCAGRLARDGATAADIAGTLKIEQQFAEWLLEPVDETPPMRWGKKSEPLNLATYEAKTLDRIVKSPVGLAVHPKFPFMLASCDAEVASGLDVECKAPNEFRLRQVVDDLPRDWLMQGQQQMFVRGKVLMHFSILAVQDVVIIPADRNDRLCNLMARKLKEQWERVLNNELPDVDPLHAQADPLVRQMFREIQEQRIPLSEAAAEAWAEYRELGKEIRERESQQVEIKNRIRLEIGSNFAGVLPGGKKMIRRKRIVSEVAAHTKDYIDVREVNYDGGPVVDVRQPVPLQHTLERADA